MAVLTGWGETKPPAGIPLHLNQDHSLARGLRHYWPLAEGAGRRVADLAPGRNDLLLGSTADWTGGLPGAALKTASGNQTSGAASERAATYSLSTATLYVFLSPIGTPADDAVPFASRGTASVDKIGLLYNVSGTAQLGYNWADNSSTYGWLSGLTVTADRWQHQAVAITATAGTAYIDGASATNAVANATATLTVPWTLGYEDFFNLHTAAVRIACAAVWDRALTAADVQTLFAAPFDLVWRPRSWWTGLSTSLPQTAAPASDVSAGTWTTDTGATTNLYAAIDEATANDADYVQSQAGPTGANPLEVALSSLTDPAVSTGHTVRVRAQLDAVTGGALTLRTEVRQGGSALSTPAFWDDTPTGTATTFEHALSGAQADAITDYATLRLRFTATQAAGAGALPSFVAAGASAAGQASITVPWPVGGHQADDIGLLFVESAGGEPANLGTAAGFAAVTGSPYATGATTAGTRLSVYWCRATSGSMTSPVVTDPGNHAYGRILVFRGCTTTGDPWDATGGGVKAAAAANATVTGVTTTVDNTLVVQALAWDLDNAGALVTAQTNAGLANVTNRSNEGTALGTGGGFSVWTGEKATAGATGDTAVTIISSINAFATVALAPAAAANTSRARVTWAQVAVPALTGPPPITGTAAGTTAAATSAASGSALLAITGTAAGTLAPAASSAAGTALLAITGTAARTLVPATGAASGVEAFAGTAARTLTPFTSTASGSALLAITGTAAGALAPVPSTASGAEVFAGTAAGTITPLTATASGTSLLAITGTAASTLVPLTSVASGSALLALTGAAAGTLVPLTSAATGSTGAVTTGTAAGTLAPTTSAASAGEVFAGTASGTLGAAASQATGTSLLAITGTAAGSLAPLTGTASGLLLLVGTGARTLAPATATATGSALLAITGTGAGTLAPATSSATGAAGAVIAGTAASTLAPATATAAGLEVFSGTAAANTPTLTSSANGTSLLAISGSAARALAPVTAQATGSAGVPALTGTAAGTVAPATATGGAAGLQVFSGTAAGTLGPTVGTGTGAFSYAAAGAGMAAPLLSAGVGALVFLGAGAVTLAAVRSFAEEVNDHRGSFALTEAMLTSFLLTETERGGLLLSETERGSIELVEA